MAHNVTSLAKISVGAKAEVVSLGEEESNQLSGYGIYPGRVLTVRQRFPSFVVKTDETELAIEKEVVRKIKVRPL